MRIDYPVAVDSGHAVWRASTTSIAPALYSSTRRDVFGIINSAEGEYAHAGVDHSTTAGRSRSPSTVTS